MVFIPKRRKKAIYGSIRKHLGSIFHELARQKGSKIVEGCLRADHIHMCVSIPPKYAVSSVIGYIKGRKRNFTGESFWARGFYVSTVGLDEDSVRRYVRDQEAEDARLDQLNMFDEDPPPSGGS